MQGSAGLSAHSRGGSDEVGLHEKGTAFLMQAFRFSTIFIEEDV
jgi:hypothetical protein